MYLAYELHYREFACGRKRKNVDVFQDTFMQTTTSKNIRDVRKILGQTQGVFAATLGVSKDTVASWEIGRSNLSRSYARRMAFATGAEEAALLRGRSPLAQGSTRCVRGGGVQGRPVETRRREKGVSLEQ